MTNRDDIRDQFSPLLDGELSPEERARVEAALASDAELLRELDALKRVDDLYRALPAEHAPAHFEQAVRERIRQPRASMTAAAPRRTAPRRYWTAGLAAAAVLLIGVGVVLVNRDRLAAPKQLATAKYGALRSAPAAEAAKASETAPPASAANAPERQREVIERFLQPGPPAAAGGIAGDVKVESSSPEGAAAAAPPMVAARAQAETESLEKGKVADRRDEVGRRAADKVRAAKPAPEPVAAPADSERKRNAASPAPVPSMADETDAVAPPREEQISAAETPVPGPLAAKEITRELAPATPPPPPVPASSPAPAPPMLAQSPAPSTEAMSATPVETPTGSAKAAEGQAVRPEARERLQALGYASKDESDTIRTIEPRTFTLRDGVWYEAGYTDQKTSALKRGSKAAQRLLDQHADLKEVLALKAPVVFKIADRWYKLDAPKN